MVVTIAPIVASSSRAGMTTLTRVPPFARTSRRAVHRAALLVRYVVQASTTGEVGIVSGFRIGTSCIELGQVSVECPGSAIVNLVGRQLPHF